MRDKDPFHRYGHIYMDTNTDHFTLLALHMRRNNMTDGNLIGAT